MTSQNRPSNGHHPSPTIEDYLAIIYVFQRDGEEIIAARLAESLDVSPPTVTATLKRMERDGWLEPAEKKGIRLTTDGYKAACTVIRRHMLTEWLLARILKVPWSRIHNEAHQIEHSISEEIELQMLTNLDHPQLCPHGNPLPGYESLSADWVQLTTLPNAVSFIIRRIHETAEGDTELMQFLENSGIIPGAKVKLLESLPFNQTLTLEKDEKQITPGYVSAHYIWVELLKAEISAF